MNIKVFVTLGSEFGFNKGLPMKSVIGDGNIKVTLYKALFGQY